MASSPAHLPAGPGAAMLLAVREEGSAAHPFVDSLREGASPGDLADVVHFLVLLHGRFPGVIDHAADRVFHPGARDWMLHTAAGFAAERAFLTRLAVAAGAVPSTPGQAQSESAVIGQMHALAVLSQSERRGTALGAAFALALDWTIVRGVLDVAAGRLGLSSPPRDLPGSGDTAAAVDAVTDGPALTRALHFGARQLLIQHRGLWDLLETRAGARAA